MKQLFYLVLILSFFNASAQINFEKGYFIKNSQERIECFIKNMDWKSNPTEFEYKLSSDAKESAIASITSVTEFGIDNESKYKRFIVNIEKSGDNLNSLSNDKNPVYQKQTVFLRVLLDGEASLYQYNESNLYKYFYETKTVPVTQLIFIKYNSTEKNSDNLNSYGSSIKTNNQFRQQLYNDVKCESMAYSDFEKISYNKDELAKHFTKYNSCTGNAESKYIAKTEKSIVNFKITVGLNSASLSIKDPNTYFNRSTDTGSKLIYSFGAEIEYILPFNKNKWGVFINPIYQKFDVTKNYINSDGFSPPHDLEHKAEIKYTSIELPIGFRYYMFLNKNSKLFINALYSINFVSGSKIVFDDDPANTFRISARSNFGIGFGYCYKNKFSAELRNNFDREILGDYIEWNAKYSSYGIQLSYKVF